jgi:uncharacterized protein
MSLFVLNYRYVSNTETISQHRPEHREYLRGLFDSGKLRMAGPTGEPGPAGGLIILDVNSAEEVEDIARADPFLKRGVVVEHSISSWSLSMGDALLK